MADRARRAHGGLTILIVVLLFATFLAPLSAFADTNLVIGGTARIAYANGDDVRLREEPGYDGAVVRMVREGAIVDVVDGPVEDGDGNLWYQVTFDDETGYIVADYLALESAGDAGDASADLPYNPAGDAIGAALIAGTNGDGVRCRTDADPGAPVITVVPEGTTVEIIGAAVGDWQPINCAGQSGYVHVQFVSYDLSGDTSGGDTSTDASGGDTSGDSVDTFSAAEATGEATVSGTNGDGVRCRASASYSASIITVLEEGSSVSLRGVTRGDFTGVICAGQNGYVASMYLGDGSDSSSGDSGGSDIVGSAFVSGTNGDGVRCRTGAGFDSSVIVVLDEGTEVSLRSGGGGDWQPVVCGGSNGWIFVEFLSSSDNSGGDTSGGGDVSGSGVISGTNGDGVRCRTQASFTGNVITVLTEGTAVDIRGDQDGDWVPVVCSGRNGWVFADFVSSGGGGSSDGGSTDGGSSNSDFVSGDVAVVANTDGAGVRLRSGASFDAAIITIVAEGKTVDVIDGSTGDWVAVATAGTSGYILMDYLAHSSGQGDTGGDSGGGSFGVGDHAMTLSALNLRYDPSFGSGIAAVAPQGTVVEITGNPSDGFYPVNWDGLQGYMHGDYLSWTDEALSTRGGSADDGGTSGGGGGGGSASGNGLVDFAMQYLGYPYIWATHGPSSFDCSGFTYWVVLNVLGIDIGAGTSTQIAEGTPVGRDELQPGDLVFFQNTYTWGLSHVGMYIGNDQFIHAENESTGVVISSLNSDYYASRWYGARRIG